MYLLDFSQFVSNQHRHDNILSRRNTFVFPVPSSRCPPVKLHLYPQTIISPPLVRRGAVNGECKEVKWSRDLVDRKGWRRVERWVWGGQLSGEWAGSGCERVKQMSGWRSGVSALLLSVASSPEDVMRPRGRCRGLFTRLKEPFRHFDSWPPFSVCVGKLTVEKKERERENKMPVELLS